MPKCLLKQYDPGIQQELEKIVDGLKDEAIDVGKVSQCMRREEVLTDEDLQDISIESSRDYKAALIVLIDRAVKLPSCYQIVLDGLRKSGYEDVVRKIEPAENKNDSKLIF